MNRPDLIPEYIARFMAANPGSQRTDFHITSITETVTLIERDPSPCIPRKIASDGVSTKEIG